MSSTAVAREKISLAIFIFSFFSFFFYDFFKKSNIFLKKFGEILPLHHRKEVPISDPCDSFHSKFRKTKNRVRWSYLGQKDV